MRDRGEESPQQRVPRRGERAASPNPERGGLARRTPAPGPGVRWGSGCLGAGAWRLPRGGGWGGRGWPPLGRWGGDLYCWVGKGGGLLRRGAGWVWPPLRGWEGSGCPLPAGRRVGVCVGGCGTEGAALTFRTARPPAPGTAGSPAESARTSASLGSARRPRRRSLGGGGGARLQVAESWFLPAPTQRQQALGAPGGDSGPPARARVPPPEDKPQPQPRPGAFPAAWSAQGTPGTLI